MFLRFLFLAASLAVLPINGSNSDGQPAGIVYWWYTDWERTPRMVTRCYEGKLEYLHRNDRWRGPPLL